MSRRATQSLHTMQHFHSWQSFRAHWQELVRTQQRQLLVVPECDATYQQLLPLLVNASPVGAIGVNLKPQALGANATYIKPQQAKQMLGQTRGLLVYRAVDEFNVSAFSALCGTVVGGSFAVLIVPANTDWPLHHDQQCRDYGCRHVSQGQAFRSWWQGQWQYSDGVGYLTVAAQSQASSNDVPESGPSIATDIVLNQQQKMVHDRVQELVTSGPQVLWISGARGRGKSVAIARAITALQGKGQRCLLTASANHNSRIVNQTDCPFQAVDALLAAPQGDVDILFVEEAASMPLFLLQRLLRRFNKVVLVSTIDGYEGTGQGLLLKLPPMLEDLGRDWQRIDLQQPLRWQANDQLEALIEASFLPRQLVAIDQAIDIQQLKQRIVRGADLVADSKLLQQAYTLLALAHYQTTPQDLRLMLDHPDMMVYLHVDETTQRLYGILCVLTEGQLEADLAQAIAAGKRRVKGHLLPQVLAQQAGIAVMAERAIWRVQRIAVHPQLQGQGLGSLMLQQLTRAAEQRQVDYLGSSFAAEPAVVNFWLQAGFVPVWAGLRLDAASGLPSLQVLQRVSGPRAELHSLRQHWYFYYQQLHRFWPRHLLDTRLATYLGIDADLVTRLLPQVAHEAGNAYALSGYLLQYLLAKDQLSELQREWLMSYVQAADRHKQFVQQTRHLVAQDQAAIEASLVAGLLAIKVEHPLYS